LKEQVGAPAIHGQVAKFIDDQKIEPTQQVEQFAERVRRVRGEQLVEQIWRMGEQHTAARGAGVDGQRDAQMRFANARTADE
jgi:hypothetical protein